MCFWPCEIGKRYSSPLLITGSQLLPQDAYGSSFGFVINPRTESRVQGKTKSAGAQGPNSDKRKRNLGGGDVTIPIILPFH